MTSSLLLPEGTRLIHIGPHKTGSTAVQSALHAARGQLAEQGVYYPRGGWRRREAGWALGLPGRWAGTPQPPMELWDRLVREIGAVTDSRVCVSNESFARADAETAAKIARDLGGDDVHIVAVARRLDRFLPSVWQERIKSRKTFSYEDWLELVLRDTRRTYDYRNVWDSHDLQALTQRWTSIVGPERFTLIVRDESDPGLLHRVFEELLGLSPGTLVPHPQSNRSLALSEVELVRHLNEAFYRNQWDKATYTALLNGGLLAMLKNREAPAPGPRGPAMPEWALREARRLSNQRVEDLRALPIRVVGDLEWLRVPDDVTAGPAGPHEHTLPVELAAESLEAVIDKAMRLIEEAATPPPAEAPEKGLLARALRRFRPGLDVGSPSPGD